eukprot:SAG11_NODE_13356_length_658_cov_4.607662_1_plen_26_part_10
MADVMRNRKGLDEKHGIGNHAQSVDA